LIFRQLFDPETSTYTYLLADDASREAVLIDTVREQFERDLTLLRELELSLRCTLETHVHADHVTASGRFRESLGSQVVVGAASGVANADVALQEGDTVRFGAHSLEAWLTPGHTDGCVTYVCREAGMAFTGDALLIRGCGRTDFQQGDAMTLFGSVREKIFSLPGRRSSTRATTTGGAR
jgi:glyoxylase-like metal-dependent hydrolase (beta-lactamase superfamily II)